MSLADRSQFSPRLTAIIEIAWEDLNVAETVKVCEAVMD
jgi:hypothetical protein